MNSVDNDEDDDGTPLTAEDFSTLLYQQIASVAAFDAIEGASRMTPTEFVVHPFDGSALLVKVAPVPE